LQIHHFDIWFNLRWNGGSIYSRIIKMDLTRMNDHANLYIWDNSMCSFLGISFELFHPFSILGGQHHSPDYPSADWGPTWSGISKSFEK